MIPSPGLNVKRLGVCVSIESITILFACDPSAFLFPDASVNFVFSTTITPSTVLPANGVNIAVYNESLTLLNKESDPPETVAILATVKSVEASLNVNVIRAVSPAFREVTSEVTMIVGSTVSIASVTELLISAPSILKLPAVSLNVPLATLIAPFVVLLISGVNVAV